MTRSRLRNQCSRCDEPLTNENWFPSYKKKRYLICRTCENARQRAYNKANPKQIWKRNKMKRYSISYEDYLTLLALQEGGCAICGSTDPGRGHDHLYVDHNHNTNNIRDLLCHSCNIGIGHFRDDPSLLNKAKRYLEKCNVN